MTMALISLVLSIGFSLHVAVSVNTRERKKLERISRYICRPATIVG